MLRLISKLFRLRRPKADIEFDRGFRLLQTSKFHEAVSCFSKAIECNPSYFRAYEVRGAVYEHLRETLLALSDYEYVINNSPDPTYAYNNRGCLYKKQKNFTAAIEDFDRAILNNPQYGFAFYNRAETYIELGEFESAIRDFKKCLALGPDPNLTKLIVSKMQNAQDKLNAG